MPDYTSINIIVYSFLWDISGHNYQSVKSQFVFCVEPYSRVHWHRHTWHGFTHVLSED